MKTKLSGKFYLSLVIFSLIGQVAWVVENMYFNVFIYKMFHASAAQISVMVAASAVTATVTTLLIGALSDKVGKRKLFICGGYILWGISILSFALIRMDILEGFAGSVTAAATLGCTLVIIMDCVMTFFGSSANDACFNAWLTDMGDDTNRGSIEGINAMMPLVAILVVFGGFMAFDLDQAKSWEMIYLIIGIVVIVVGLLGIFLIQDTAVRREENSNYFANIIYGFRPSVIRSNKLLYIVLVAFAVFGISIQSFMPYLILYYEKSLGMTDYVLVMAPAIILAAVITAFYGRLYDRMGFEVSVIPTVLMLLLGYTFLYLFRDKVPVFIGSLFMMTGYLSGMAVFGAMIRDNTPVEKTGLFQGLRIFGQVFIPGIIGPALGAAVLQNAETVVNGDGTTSFIPNNNIYLAAFVVAVALLFGIFGISYMRRTAHNQLTTGIPIDKIPYSQYPRPQFRRDSYICLNGKWEDGVVVPFPLESKLSENKQKNCSHYSYHRHVVVPNQFVKDTVLLHFDAVDQIAEVYINNKIVYRHEGGYLPFTVDITKYFTRAITGDNGETEFELRVDITDQLSHVYPYGKQTKKRGGMWYTPVSGIWQSVWLESVSTDYIRSLKITPDLNGIMIELDSDAMEYQVIVSGNGFQHEATYQQKSIRIDVPDGKYWTPDTPYLYDICIRTEHDEVKSYFALRTITIQKVNNVSRLCLNDKPYFFHGVLDQGYYPEGIFLPNSAEGYRRDILAMKELGINTLRKHIKVEPAIFYEMCDRLGMVVFQDMVNNSSYSFLRDTALPTLGKLDHKDANLNANISSREFFEKHTQDTIDYLYNFPCICYYTIFNEGWGQFESDRIYANVKRQDSSRVIDSTSGWFHQKDSDVESLHIYFKPVVIKESERPVVVSEFGGYSYRDSEHSYSKFSNYGYGNLETTKELSESLLKLYREEIVPNIKKGLCGTIYTQLSDVEDETNGLYTYDRRLCKVDKATMLQIADLIKDEMN